MGEEEKKPEEKKEEEVKKPAEEAEKKPAEEAEAKKPAEEEKKTEEAEKKPDEPPPPPPPPPPEEIVMRVFMHCEGCARKVKKCLRSFEGVEEVQTDCKTHNVVVKGKKAAADPLKVVERLQKKVNRKVDLLSAIPPPPPVEEKKAEENKENVKPEEKKEEPVVITVVLKVHMHCEACAQEIRKRIMRMKGVQSADPDLKGSQVTVKGVFDPTKLVEYVYKRTGKHALIVKIDPEKKPEAEAEATAAAAAEEKGKEEEKKGDGEEEKKEEKKEEGNKEGEEAAKPAAAAESAAAVEEGEQKIEVIELRKNEFYHYPPKYNMEYVYPPQIFSDENPNACSIM